MRACTVAGYLECGFRSPISGDRVLYRDDARCEDHPAADGEPGAAEADCASGNRLPESPLCTGERQVGVTLRDHMVSKRVGKPTTLPNSI
jgi:hypothetical protein